MLAQNFKTATDLSITDAELGALIKVLGMLERDELRHSSIGEETVSDCFNMGPYIVEGTCGTIGCIAGWAHLVSGRTVFPWVLHGLKGTESIPQNLWELFHCNGVFSDRENITPAQAAVALRSYLTTGDTNWAEALG